MRKLKLEELGRISPEAFVEQTKVSIVVVLDNLRSGLNVGSVFRTSDAFAIEAVHLCGITPVPPHKEIFKTAIGAEHTVQWQHFESISDSIEMLKEEGYKVIGIEQTDHSIELNELTISTDEKWAIVMGNEVEGISDNVLPMLDIAVELAQYGTKHSLNVAVCAGIVIHHFSSKLRKNTI